MCSFPTRRTTAFGKSTSRQARFLRLPARAVEEDGWTEMGPQLASSGQAAWLSAKIRPRCMLQTI
eukprot:1846313-Rhodomonas_salina.1